MKSNVTLRCGMTNHRQRYMVVCRDFLLPLVSLVLPETAVIDKMCLTSSQIWYMLWLSLYVLYVMTGELGKYHLIFLWQ